MATDNAENYIIECENITKRYGHTVALNGINFKVGKGDFLTIFGPNGAGKTTLLKILSNLIKPTSGTVKIVGTLLDRDDEKTRHMIGVISHNTFIYNNLTPIENLELYGKMYGVKNLKNKIEEVLEEVGLTIRRYDPVRTFSRGMQQRLCIARALIHSPSIIYLDEPYTGLDQHASLKLKNIMEGLRKGARTIIMITHNIPRGLEICTKVAIQVKGRFQFFKEITDVDTDTFEDLYFRTVGEGHY